MNSFFKLPFILDGATGTNLYKCGMPHNVCVEKWILDNPDIITKLQEDYAGSGSNVVAAPTFGAHRAHLSQFGFEGKVSEFNLQLVALSKKAVGGKALVAGNVSPTGLFIEPFGDSTFDGLLGIYAEQASALLKAGVDYIAIETMMNLTESRAALLTAKETGLPVTVTLTVDDNGKTLSGGNVLSCLITLSAMGADAVGLNCSTGPQVIYDALKDIAQYIPVPLIAKPNAGVPYNGVYSLSPNDFASFVPLLLKAGVGILGGCCGSDPSYIKAIHDALSNNSFTPVKYRDDLIYAANERQTFLIDDNFRLSQEIECDENFADNLSDTCDEDEYSCVLCRIKDKEQAKRFGFEIHTARCAVAVISDDAEAFEEAMKLYQGRAVVDSRSKIDIHTLQNICLKYGAVLK